MVFNRLLRRDLTRNDIFIIVANLVPVVGVWCFGWSATEAFTVYAMETIVLGLITLLMLFITTLFKGRDTWYNGESRTQVSGFMFMFFFAVHYGLFVAVQTSIFAESAGISPPGTGLLYFFLHWYEFVWHDRAIAIMLCVFAVSYLAQVFVPYMRSGAFRHASMMRLMFQPYGRIFIQQITVIFGSMFLTFGWGKAFILIFAVVKTAFDMYFNFDRILEQAMQNMEKNNEGTKTG